jgi:hypothetical protein
MNKIIFLIAGVVFAFAALSSCREDGFATSPSDRLAYSADTVTFDTIFTTVGSVTKGFKIYNKNDKNIRISKAYLRSGEQSDFRINIDGVSANSFENIDIPPNDSVFVFVEVTLDPVNSNNPVIVEDAVVFTSNSNTEEIILEAIGQDVHLYKGVVINSETWTNDKPYLIIGGMAVDSGSVLTIEEGVRVYLHYNASLIVWGKLEVNGTFGNPVVFDGDRFDRGYDRSAGAWGTIFIHPRSRDNIINYAIIKNPKAGFQVGEPEEKLRMPSIRLNNVFVRNASFASLVAYSAELTANNCIFADAQYHGLVFLLGGKYNINQCTVSLVGAFSVSAGMFEDYQRSSTGACIAFSNRYFPYYTLDKNYIFIEKTLYRDLQEANFTNTIFYGSNRLELIKDSVASNAFNYYFDHCILKEVDDSIDQSDSRYYNELILNEYPRFINDSIIQGEYNFGLDTLSPAKDKGSMDFIDAHPELQYDYEGKLRTTDGKPDLGAIERRE